MFRSRSARSGLSGGTENFDLLIHGTAAGYRADVRDPESGREAHADFTKPFAEVDPAGVFAAGSACRDLRSLGPEARDLALRAGRALFESIFAGEVLVSWRIRLYEAESAGKALRLRLHLNSPELWDWPWELLDDPLLGFLASRPATPVVRYVEMPDLLRPLRVRPPIRVLAVSACPAGFSPLEVREELGDLESALLELREAGRVELQRLEGATREALRRKLQETGFHVLHFIGHGALDTDRGGGVVLLEREDGGPEPLGGQELSVLLQTNPQLRLVILNACHGARGSAADPFAGLAQSLIQGRLPAVVAMRSAVTDRAAIAFSRNFYASLSRREPVDRAVSQARHAMFEQDSAEWASPVLAMRSPDGRLFTLFWWEILQDEAMRLASVWRRGLAALVILFVLFVSLRPLARRWIDLNLAFALLNPAECPSPPGLPIAFVKVEPGLPLRPFCIGRFEVTQGLWRKVMGRVGSRRHGDALPVVRISWNGAASFLGELNRRQPGGVFRLPTEAEWDLAERAGKTELSVASAKTANCANSEEDDGYQQIAPAGSFQPNAWGLYDMVGNVSEWVSDGDATGKQRVRRGGSFNIVLRNCAAYRFSAKPDIRYGDTGFRVVREPVRPSR
jgi:hypothetical protein